MPYNIIMTLTDMEITFAISALAGGTLERIFQGTEGSTDWREIMHSALAVGCLGLLDQMFLTEFFKNRDIPIYDWIIPTAVVAGNFFLLENTLFRNRNE